MQLDKSNFEDGTLTFLFGTDSLFSNPVVLVLCGGLIIFLLTLIVLKLLIKPDEKETTDSQDQT